MNECCCSCCNDAATRACWLASWTAAWTAGRVNEAASTGFDCLEVDPQRQSLSIPVNPHSLPFLARPQPPLIGL